VARLTYAPGAVLDLERLRNFVAQHDPETALAAAEAIVEAVCVLERHPLIGRPVEAGMHELLISHGRTGYVALYDWLEAIDTVVILALRHQREAGYGHSR
jgi:plasmid stabilization system protein ParE